MLHLAPFFPKPYGHFLMSIMIGMALSLVTVHCDLLTGIAATATLALININYPLLILESQLGNLGHWAWFGLFAAV